MLQMLPYRHIQSPDKPALIMASSGKTLMYSELEANSNQIGSTTLQTP